MKLSGRFETAFLKNQDNKAAVSRLILAAVLILALGLSASCSNDDGNSREQGDINADFYFLIISDTHVRLPGNPDAGDYNAQGNLDNLTHIIDRINADYGTSAFVAVTGDMVGCLFSEDSDDYGTGADTTAERYKSMVDTLSIPVYSLLGNHDYQKGYDPVLHEGISSGDQEAIESVWKKVLGIDPYYSIVYEGLRLIFANSNRGDAYTDTCQGCDVETGCTGSFDAEQIAWMRAELSNPEPAIIFMHHPPITDNSYIIYFGLSSFLIEKSDDFYDVVDEYQDKIIGIFAGHGHVWANDTLDNVEVYETAAIGDGNADRDNVRIVEVNVADKKMRVTIGK